MERERLGRPCRNFQILAGERFTEPHHGNPLLSAQRMSPMRFLCPEWHDRLPSTNTEILNRLRAGELLPSGFVLAAREQTAGRGRRQRKWISQPGRDLTFSFFLCTPLSFPRIFSLPMATAIGVAEVLEESGIAPRTKWPNDLLVEGRKICGILAERGRSGLVIGVGLNVNMTEAEAQKIDQPATSMRIETGREFPIETVLAQILQVLPPWIDRWREKSFSGVREAWESRCDDLGKWITVEEGQIRRSGRVEGFGEAGQLLLRGADGLQCEIWSGETFSS